MSGDPLKAAAQSLANAKSALFITGAGMSADSGLPTYRGIGGLYDSVDTDDGVPIEVALSGHMMRTQPELCWKHIATIEAACRGASPNDGHFALARMEQRIDRVVVLTQNVDGLHRAAGSTDVIDIHGDVRELICTRCDFRERRSDYAGMTVPPECPTCGAVVRPDVVLFGEMLPAKKTKRLVSEVERGFDVVFSIGTTSVFPYIAGPFIDAAARGRPAIEINPGQTEVSDAATIRISGGAAATLAALARL